MFIELDVWVTKKSKDAAVEKGYRSVIWVGNNWNDFRQTFWRNVELSVTEDEVYSRRLPRFLIIGAKKCGTCKLKNEVLMFSGRKSGHTHY